MTATICLLTYNGEQFLDEVIQACRAQVADFNYDVLVLDSGSTDATLEIVARHPDIRLHCIPNEEFGHGRTRNLAASLAAGDIVVFLTQDATPVGTTWLADLVRPILQDSSVAGVFARQTPRPGCGPSATREVERCFRTTPPAGFFSNVCSAIRRTALDAIPFREVAYAEDRQFAADAYHAGLHVEYVAEATVLHSHDLALGAYFRRMFDEARGVASSGGALNTGVLWLAGAAVRGTLLDWHLVATSRHYPWPAKLRWAVKSPGYNVARRLAIWLAARRLPEPMTRAMSLEAARRQTVR